MGSPSKANPITTPSSSPKVNESPSFHLFRDLSPLKSFKAQQYCQRFTHINFSIPPPVFTSPRMEPVCTSLRMEVREISSPTSLEINAADSQVSVQSDGHLKPEIVHKEEDAYSPSQYLTDHPEMEVNTNSSVLCPQQENDMPSVRTSSFNYHEDIINQATNITGSDMRLGPGFEAHCHEQYVPQSIEGYNHSDQGSRPTARGSVKGNDQRHYGVSRHLHFGGTMGCKLTGHETQDSSISCSPASLPNIEIMVPLHVEPSRTPKSWQACSHEETVTFLGTFCPSQSVVLTQDSVHNRSVCIPSGLGLPLKSITRSLSLGSDLTTSKLASNQNAQEERQLSDGNHSSTHDPGSILNSSATRDIYSQLEDYQQESQASATAGSSSYPIISMQPPSDSILLTPCQQHLIPYKGRTLTSPNTDMFTKLNKASPKRNRKRSKHIIDSEGCKRCNCKRSKCLKLYCECFAAGVYCLDSCACENCFNRPEYEDTVLDTRQQIEARNPLAFAPKVVKPVTSSPANIVDEASWTTPSSARHKRGCNCKKSKCLKKYCECYQAGVGCSTSCRCEDCNNAFGRKSESTYRRAEKWESPSHEQMDNFETSDDFIRAGRSHQFSKWEDFPDLTPLSPLSHHLSGLGATSTSLDIKDHSKVSQAQAHQGISLLSSTGYYNSQYSPCSLTPKLHARKVLSELNSDSLFYNMLKDDARPGILKNTSSLLKAVQGSSPNRKRVLSPQIQSQDSGSGSSEGFRSSHRSDLPVVPSFPSLDDDIGVSKT